eukprot:TRINITY_DN573_c0_g4_i3.p1 TRINITY_DN573_c0_g4~~TRINITY_DN573_c0_g4_i3.p1  ORF type:complete len:617 (-),score=124.55 TRINITY_DN573_c0_g4_i3:648-2498(-)
MSSKLLFALLEQLEFKPGTAIHSPDAYAWSCEQEGARTLIRWLCNNISKSNLLTLEEIAEFKQLEKQGKVLQGEALREAYVRVTRRDDANDAELEQSIQRTREEDTELRIEIPLLQKRLNGLRGMGKALEDQEIGVCRKAAGREHSAARTLQLCETMAIQLEEQTQELTLIMEELARTVQQIQRNHTGEGAGGRLQLCLSSFTSFLRQDEACQKELVAWQARQFGKNGRRADSSSFANGTAGYSDFEDFEGIANRQEQLRQYERRVAELDRLVRAFTIGEAQRVAAVADSAAAAAMVACAQTQLARGQRPATFKEEDEAIKRRLTEMEDLVLQLESEEEAQKSQVAALCSELATLNTTYVFQGDYEQKRRRQEADLQSYQQFLGHLVDELACHALLDAACQLDEAEHDQAWALLQAAEADMEEVVQAASLRMSAYSSVDAQPSSVGGTTGSMENHAIEQVARLLDANSTATGGNHDPSAQVREQVHGLERRLAELRAELECADRSMAVQDMLTTAKSASDLLLSASSQRDPHVDFLPKAVADEMQKLSDLNSEVEAAVTKLEAQRTRYSHLVEHMGEPLQAERRVFIDFFSNPNRLRGTARALERGIVAVQRSHGA